MTEYVYGKLHGMDEKKRIIAIKDKQKIRFYYMAKAMFQNFMLYFKDGIYIFMTVDQTKRKYRGLTVQNVENIEKLISPHGKHPKIYYDISMIKSSIRKIVHEKKPHLFLDFEMSMPPFRNYQNFVSEIIQVGMVLTNEHNEIIETHRMYIKPILSKEISDRTQKFLHITQSDIDSGVEYKQFHDTLKQIQMKYRPQIYVWGQNDQIELRKMGQIHNLPDLTKNTQIIDLLKLHKTYFGLKNDLGLFNAYKTYYQIDLSDQMHDALEDAMMTKKVFDSFQEIVKESNHLTILF